jgi:hypothetical protein
MKKSAMVAVSLAGSVAALMAGCSQTQTADCVGANGQVLPDSYCQNNGSGGAAYYGGAHWIYGGRLINRGGTQSVTGGSLTPSPSGEIDTRSGGTLRGGFGGGDDGGGRGGGE